MNKLFEYLYNDACLSSTITFYITTKTLIPKQIFVYKIKV